MVGKVLNFYQHRREAKKHVQTINPLDTNVNFYSVVDFVFHEPIRMYDGNPLKESYTPVAGT